VNCLGERLEGEAKNMYKKYFNARWTKNPLFNNAAQALELLYAFERIPEVVNEALKLPDAAIVAINKKDGKGAGAVEAPRGTLFHYYEITKGLVSHSDLITPTAQNAEDIERYCYIAAQKLLDAGQEDKIKDRMDLVVRSFDPCISCSVHMAQVKKASEGHWKDKLTELTAAISPVFIGMGMAGRSDDRVGLELALELRRRGIHDVWLETELEDRTLADTNDHQPVIFLDALDFGEAPGKITIIPLQTAAWNSVLSHRFLPLVTGRLNLAQQKNSFLLGIQPGSIREGEPISGPLLQAMEKILDEIKN
jgi:sulfhydrogenase subunit alpha